VFNSFKISKRLLSVLQQGEQVEACAPGPGLGGASTYFIQTFKKKSFSAEI